MNSLDSLTNAEQARRLVEDPSIWGRLVEIHGSPHMAYNHLRNAAGKTLDFEEYLELLSICLDHGGDNIRETVEDRLPRSIKNQLLRGSPRGRSYPIETLADVSKRLAAYDRLDVDVPSLYEEVTVVVEHLHDMDLESHPKALYLRLLLSELLHGEEWSDDLVESVAFVVRYWLVLETTKRTTLETAIADTAPTFTDLVLDPLPDDERDADVRFEDASETPFDSKHKEDLYLSVFTRTGSLEAFTLYVYLSARRHIETERHHDGTTTRGELLVATDQLALLSSFDDLPVDTTTQYYVRSNYHLVKGMNAADGRWLSTKDYNSREGPRYRQAAIEYATAAYHIQEVRPDRALKHVSLAFRHLANQYDHEYANERLVHATAIDFFIENANWGADEGKLRQELVYTHEYLKTEAEAWLALENGNFENARDLHEECEALRESVTLTEIKSHTDAIYRLADGREAELDGRYDDAIAHYRMVADTDPTIKRRCRLAEIKQSIDRDEYETARDLAETSFPEDHIVIQTVRVLSVASTVNV